MFACIFIPDYRFQETLYGNHLHDALLDCAEAWSPRVEAAERGLAVLDLEGLERLFGSYSEIATALSEKTSELGLSVHVAVASNPDAAIHAAKAFAGITLIAKGLEAKQLRDLPIALLDPSEKIQEVLKRWGIRTFGALAALPVNGLSGRLGADGPRLHQLACGRANRLLRPRQEPLRFIESADLDFEIAAIEQLIFILARLLGQICTRLKFRGLATHEVRLTLGEREYVLRLPIPTQDSKLLLKLLELEVSANPPGYGVSQIDLEAIHTKPRVVQHGLFVPLSPEPEKLELTLARIAAIVGPDNVGSAELLDTWRPGAFHLSRFTVNDGFSCSGHSMSALDGHRPPATGLAFRTFRPALEATVNIVGDGRPNWIAFSGVYGRIVSACGPWRNSGDWWTGKPWSRDEWDIALDTTLYRIYLDHLRRRWFVEGVYD